ncbi:HAD family hydrolase [Streptomyces albiaxialis]
MSGLEGLRAVVLGTEGVLTGPAADGARAPGAGVPPGAWWLLRALEGAGISRAAVARGPGARELLGRAGLAELLDAVVDDEDVARLGPAPTGGPDARPYQEAAARLGVVPGDAAVIESTPEGVAAGRAGGFGLVVGVSGVSGVGGAPAVQGGGDGFARGAGGTGVTGALRAHGARLVVGDLSELLAPRAQEG